MASNTSSAKPAEAKPSNEYDPNPLTPNYDGRVWGITTASTRGTSGPGGNITGNGKGSDFNC